MPRAIRKLIHSLSSSRVAGVFCGALIVPIMLLAFANYSALEFVGTYLATLPVAGILLWLTGQWQPRRLRPKR